MKKVDQYRQILRNLKEWEPYLLEQSRLPGPRANIELARAVALEGEAELFESQLENNAEIAPTNTPGEFLAFCGALGIGRLLSEGQIERLGELRSLANDPRWRVREAVAMGLQAYGRHDVLSLIAEMKGWVTGSLLERRAAAAGLCEPDLLNNEKVAETVLQILDEITLSIKEEVDRRAPNFKALRKALGYCWSVAICASPQKGKAMLETWLMDSDRDVRWVCKENLKKKRLQRLDSQWVNDMQRRLAS
jgi:hypothetical protein